MLDISGDRQHASEALAQTAAPIVVVVPAYNAVDHTIACIRSILTHTQVEVPLVVIDDASNDLGAIDELRRMEQAGQLGKRLVLVLTKESNGGFVESANMAFELAGRADVVLVNSDVEVTHGWLDALCAAAQSASTIASVSTLTNHGTIVSVPERNEPGSGLPSGLSLDVVASRVREGSSKLYPRLPTAIGHCTYFRRLSLDVVGGFDEAFSPGYGEEVDWSQKALAMGFEHILADDVFVYHKGGVTFAALPAESVDKNKNDALVATRYPYYLREVQAVEADSTSTLAASLLAARRSILGLHLLVDGMCLGPTVTGTQVVVTQLSRALALLPQVAQVEVLIPPSLPRYARQLLCGVDKVTLTPSTLGGRRHGQADVALRPYQFTSVPEVDWLRRCAERVVVVQLDLIAFNDPAYFDRRIDWDRYRDVQRMALASVDGVAFISETVRLQADRMNLLPRQVPCRVIHLGTDSGAEDRAPEEVPRGCEELPDGFLLQLGATFLHKNRLWSLRVMRALLAAGWTGSLVLAGPQPSQGSSRSLEAAWLTRNPAVAGHVVSLGGVSEAEKVWLYRHCGLVLYPTVTEGFGLVPFEAASFGKACLSTRQAALDEVLPQEMLTLDGLDPETGAVTAAHLLSDGAAREAIVESLRARQAEFTWSRTATCLAELMWEVSGQPRRNVVAVQTPGHVVGLGRLTAPTPTRRILGWVAAIALLSPFVRNQLLSPGSRRGVMVRRAYHRAMGTAQGRRRR